MQPLLQILFKLFIEDTLCRSIKIYIIRIALQSKRLESTFIETYRPNYSVDRLVLRKLRRSQVIMV